jgi:acyl-CoA reductase-like NAD-dependent aldehyde dehydrogenase
VTPARDPRALATSLARSVQERREAFVAASVLDLDFPPDDTAGDVDYTVAHLERNLAREVIAMAGGRRPITHPGQEALFMLPSNMTVFCMLDIARAALAGNTVRARMTSRAPTVSDLIQETFEDVVPGAVRMEKALSGPAFLTYALESDEVPFLMVWGGEALGDELLERARMGARKRIVFEGPGKDPAIVLDGADVRKAASQLIGGKFYNAGQMCTAPENLLVHRSIHDEIVELFVAACASARVGDPREPGVQIGPMISAKVPDIVRAQLADAVDQGAEIVHGGLIEGPYVHPTVVTGITPEMQIFRDETFAPVFATRAFDDEDEAIALARDSRFGLRVSVGGPGSKRVVAHLLGADYAEPVDDLVFGKFGVASIDAFEDTEFPPAFGGYGKSGWVWDNGQLYQGPKSTLRESTVPDADSPLTEVRE